MLKQRQRLTQLCLIFSITLCLVLLYRWQRVFYMMCADYILSDMPAHVRLALGHNDYSLASVIVRLLWGLFEENRAQTALSLVLTANQLFGVFSVWLLLRRMFPSLEKAYALLAVLLAHLCGPWIVPGQTAMYIGAYNGNVLHNMTVLFSRSFIPFDLLLFFRLWDARRERLELRTLLAFALCLLVTTLFKPNYLGAFAPLAFVLLVIDFIRTRARGFKNEFLIGLAVVPSLAALVWSASVLYAADFAGTSSGVALRVMSLSVFLGMLVMYFRGLLLPIWSFALQGPREDEQREHLQIFTALCGVAIAEALFLTETGWRAAHGNYDWGALALYPSLFSIAIALLFRMLKGSDWKERGDRIKAIVGLVLLLGHLIIGVYCLHRPGTVGYEWYWF